MKRVLFVLWVACCPSLLAQTWSGILDPTRATTWAGVGSGVVQTRNTVCITFFNGSGAPSGGTGSNGDYYYQTGGLGTMYHKASGSWSTDGNTFSADITTAIGACPSNQVVYLSAGTYTFASGVDFNAKSNITLRGAGPEVTILLAKTHAANCVGRYADICIENATGYYTGSSQVQPGGSNACSWTATYSQGSSSIILNSCGANMPAIGDTIILDQANDTTVQTGLFICDVMTTCDSDGAGPGRVIGGVTYGQQQYTKVTSISGSGAGPYTVGISPAIIMNNWQSGKNPGMWWTGTQVTGDGIENLTIQNDSSNDGYANMEILNGSGNWIKNVRSLYSSSSGQVELFQSSNNVIRDSYFDDAVGGAEESYGVLEYMGGLNLTENNIFYRIASPILNVGEGSVAGYNYTNYDFYSVGGNSVWMQGSYFSHDNGKSMGLAEGNQTNEFICDNTHGISALGTAYRNWLTGYETGKTESLHTIQLESYCRGFNFVGNVMGTGSIHTQYKGAVGGPSCPTPDTTEVTLGWTNVSCGAGARDDSVTTTSTLLWGNYDVISAAVRWCGNSSDTGWVSVCGSASEIPTSGITYINGNSVPTKGDTGAALPDSFYLSSAPSFWGTQPYPAIGPDVTGGTAPGGHGYNIPAAVCAIAATIDPAYQVSNAITGSSWSMGTETITVSNSIASGQYVIINSGAPVLTLTNSSTQITYAVGSNPGSITGVVLSNNVLLFDASSCYNGPPPGTSPSAPDPKMLVELRQ